MAERVADAFAVVDRELLLAVDAEGRRRQDLAHPVRRQGEVVALVEESLRDALVAPPGEVRNEDVGPWTEVQLGLDEDDPPAGVALLWVAENAQPPYQAGGAMGVASMISATIVSGALR